MSCNYSVFCYDTICSAFVVSVLSCTESSWRQSECQAGLHSGYSAWRV